MTFLLKSSILGKNLNRSYSEITGEPIKKIKENLRSIEREARFEPFGGEAVPLSVF
jgi:hypothetical protein